MEDSKIIELYNERSETALVQTAAKYGNYCARIAFNVLKSREDSEECVNDAYLRLWNSIPPQRPANLKAYLGRIVRNRAIDMWSAEGAQKRGGGEALLCLDELAECVGEGAAALSDGPEEALSYAETVRHINSWLASQEEQKMKIFMRRYWYMDSIRDIAKAYGFSDSKVKTTLFRMREELKAELSKEGTDI